MHAMFQTNSHETRRFAGRVFRNRTWLPFLTHCFRMARCACLRVPFYENANWLLANVLDEGSPRESGGVVYTRGLAMAHAVHLKIRESVEASAIDYGYHGEFQPLPRTAADPDT